MKGVATLWDYLQPIVQADDEVAEGIGLVVILRNMSGGRSRVAVSQCARPLGEGVSGDGRSVYGRLPQLRFPPAPVPQTSAQGLGVTTLPS
jgi:hypothetical protein